MFADLLTHNEKGKLFSLMTFLAGIDGEIADSEKVFLNHIYSNMELDIPNEDGNAPDAGCASICADVPESLELCCASFERDKARRIVVLELLRLAYADGKYQDSERAGLRKIASLFELEPAEVEGMESWVREGTEWHARGRALMGLD